MNKFAEEKISEIAQELDCGLICFVHKDTHEIKSYPEDPFDLEPWEDVIKEVEADIDNYLRFDIMTSYESYKIMEDFIELIEDEKIAGRFLYAISKKKPFQRFKFELDNYHEVKKSWYEYKSRRMIEWVKKQVPNFDEEEKELEDEE